MEIKVLIEAPELALAINNLAKALGGAQLAPALQGKKAEDPTSLSDADTVALPNGEDPNKYTMFQDLKAVAVELKEADESLYEEILYKYVPEGKKYSAILPKDWGKATKEFKAALKDLTTSTEEEEEPVKKAGKGGTKPPKNTKPKKVEEPEEEEEEDYEDEEDFEEAMDVDAPRLSVAELRALAAKAKNKGVSVGAIMKKIAGVVKVSEIPENKRNAFEDALNEAMEE